MKHKLTMINSTIDSVMLLEKKNMSIKIYDTPYVYNSEIIFPELKEFDTIYRVFNFWNHKITLVKLDKKRDIITEVTLVDNTNKEHKVIVSYTDMPFDPSSLADISINEYDSDKLINKTTMTFNKDNNGKITSLHYSSECLDDTYKINRNFNMSKARFAHINGVEKLPEKITKIVDIVKPDGEETVTFTTLNNDFLITTRSSEFSKTIYFSVEGEDSYYETIRTKTIEELELTEDDINNDVIKKEREVSDMLGYRKIVIERSYYKNGTRKEVEQPPASCTAISTVLYDESNRIFERSGYLKGTNYNSSEEKDGIFEAVNSETYKYESFEHLDITTFHTIKTYTANGEVLVDDEFNGYCIGTELPDSRFPVRFEYEE